MATEASALLQIDVPVDDEVVQFVTHEAMYRLYTARGLQIDITRTSNYQPDIKDPDDFHTYMWVEARQGYFLLSQRFQNGTAGRWVVYREMIPKATTRFFLDFGDVLPQYIETNPATL